MRQLLCNTLCGALCLIQVLNFSPATYLKQNFSPVTVLAEEQTGLDSAGSNSSGFVIGNYDVKDVEKEKKDSYQSYDTTGPILENATVVNLGGNTSQNIKETVNNDMVSESGGKYIITIDPGHSAKSTGSSGNGIKEEVYTLEIGKILYGMLKKDSRFEVHMTRNSEAAVDNHDRPKISNKFKSDCFLSIHLNFSDASSAHGSETEVNMSGKGKTSMGMGNKEYATIIQKNMQKATGFRDRGLKDRPNLIVLKNNNAAAALAEIGFLTNSEEAKALKNNKEKYAKGFYNAFVEIATKNPKPTEKTSITEASSSKLNSSLTSNVSLKNVASAKKVVNKGKYESSDKSNPTGTYSIAGRKYTMYAQSAGTSSWCSKHGCSATVLAMMISSAGYKYTADQIHSAGADKDYSTKAAIKKYGIKSGKNSDYDANNRSMPMTCFGLSAVMRNMGLSCDYVATWATDEDAISDITAALAQGRCVAVYVNSNKHNGIQFTDNNHCILLVGFQKNGCLNFINPAGGRLNYSHITKKQVDLKLSDLVKYYMLKNTKKANQVVFNNANRSGGYVKY